MDKYNSTEDPIILEVMQHYDSWNEDLTQRLTRKNGWNDITDAYWGKLPDDFPFINRVVDPRVKTVLIEKNARLVNSKLKGKLNPREGADMIKAKINNAILDYQWDAANEGGSMITKWGMTDMDTRLYASKFAAVPWKHVKNKKGEVEFDGNEFIPKDIRNIGIDPSCDNVKNAKWLQERSYVLVKDLKTQSDKGGKLKNIDLLLSMINDKSSRRDTKYNERILQLKGLQDKLGDDKAFPVIELVTEYRKDKWITFSPEYKILLRDIDNPYDHKQIPFVQLCYYPIQGDPIGESEVEPVLSLWKAIQASINGFLDNMMVHVKPPLKIMENSAQMETIVFGPDAQWIVTRPDAVTEFQGSGEALRYFQTTYTSLVSAFNTAMGEFSQGTSNIDPTASEKTATEVKASSAQQRSRDQRNQIALSEAIKDMMMMWLSNNKQFLFADETKREHVMRIVGVDNYTYFEKAGLADDTLPDEAAQTIAQIIEQNGGQMSEDEINQLVQAGQVPKHPVLVNPEEKDINKLQFKKKMEIADTKDNAELTIVPEDMTGYYDYIPSVKSMAQDQDAALLQARQMMFSQVTSPVVQQMLMQEGWKVSVKDMIVNSYEDMGAKDADRFFSKVEQPMMPQPGMQPNAPQMQGHNPQNMQTQANAPMPAMAGSMEQMPRV